MRSRSTVRVIRGAARWGPWPTSLSVSDVGTAATAPTPARARAITASIVSRLTNGRAASWIRIMVASSRSASSPARTESARCAPPATNASLSPRSLPSHSGGRSAYPGGRATTTCRTSGWPVNGRSARNSIGTPTIGRNCLGSPGPARTPAPAATTTTPTSGCETTGELTDSLQPNHLEVTARSARASRQEHPPKALARPFGQAPLHAGDGTDLAAEADLSEEQCIGRHRAIVDGGHQGCEDGKIGGRLDEPHAARHVHKDVEISERQAAAPLEHGEQEGEPAMIETGRHPLRRAESRLRGDRLDFDQHRARPFHQGRDRRSRCAGAATGQEGRRGVRDGLEARSRHPEHTDLVYRAESVLHCAEDSVIECRFALEVQHGVHDVLERFGAGDAAALRHMTDEHDRGPRLLGEAHEPGGALAHLPDVAGSAFELLGIGGLHRVEQHDARFQLRRVMNDGLEPCLSENVNVAGVLLETIGTQSQLVGRLLTGDVERRHALVLEPSRALHEQRGL